jgi:hypothetical protein
VPHRQIVFTIPRRLRLYCRYDRRLLGQLAGTFPCLPKIDNQHLLAAWQDKFFDLFLAAGKIDRETVDQMPRWPHSGFRVDNSVYLPARDTASIVLYVPSVLLFPYVPFPGSPGDGKSV